MFSSSTVLRVGREGGG